MIIFSDYEDIFGSPETEHLKCTLDEFFALLDELRPRLADKAYLLDQYVQHVLNAASYPVPSDAAEKGFYAAGELNKILSAVLADKKLEHPLYEDIKAFVDEHPLEYQEDTTRSSIYSIALMNLFMDKLVQDYWKEIWEFRSKLDVVEMRHLYHDICKHLGGKRDMERLTVLMKERFIIAPAMTCFIQGLTTDLVQMMTVPDPETRKCCYELVGGITSSP